jgi:lysophospholipase L1-like esterase
VLIGDSLAVGIQGLLPSLLPGWSVTSDALTSRPLAAGMQLAERADLTSRPTVLALSLFTNDDPRATAALAAAVQRSVALVGRHGCAVWATIVRPPYQGVSYAAANATLRRLAAQYGGAVLLVPWAEEVARHPGWVAPDGVHGTPAGYQARAQMYAQAALACER